MPRLGARTSLLNSCYSQRALQEETGLISVLLTAEETLSTLPLPLPPERTHGLAGPCNLSLAPLTRPSSSGGRALPAGSSGFLGPLNLLQRPSAFFCGGGLDGFWTHNGKGESQLAYRDPAAETHGG